MTATNIKNLNYCKLYARIDDEEKRQWGECVSRINGITHHRDLAYADV